MKWFFAVLLSFPIFPAAGAVWHVKESSAAQVGDGRAWETAFRTIEQALGAAVAGDEVWVAAGDYANQVVLPAAVSLYGGFRGDETSIEQRDIETRPTRLKSVIIGPAQAGQTSTVDGFQIHATMRLSNGAKADLMNLKWILGEPFGGGVGAVAAFSGTNCAVNVSNMVIRPFASAATYQMSGSPTPVVESGIILRNATYTFRRCRVLSTYFTRVLFDLGGTGTVGECRFVGNATPSGSSATAAADRMLIRFQGGTGIVERCWFSANQATAIRGVSATVVTVRNNLFGDGAVPAFALKVDPGGNVKFLHNTVVARAAGVNCVSHSGTGGVANNLFVSGPGRLWWFLRADSAAIVAPAGLSVRGNAFFETPLRSSGGATVQPGVNWNVDTLWPFSEDPGRGRPSLAADSTLVDAALADAEIGAVDFAGRSRVQGVRADIGAFESGEGPAFPAPVVVHVRPDGNDSSTGDSPENALRSLQTAIWKTAEDGVGEVRLGGGRYPGNLFLPAGVSLTGENPNPSGPPVATNLPTVIDGWSSNQCVVQIAGLTDARSGEPSDRITGIRFEHGLIRRAPGGGAVSSATLGFHACVFEDNVAEINASNVRVDDPSAIPGGGALIASESASIDRCLFLRNRALAAPSGFIPSHLEGGAVQIRGDAWVRDSIFVSNSVTLRNGPSYGGAIGIEHRGKAGSLENNTFIGNSSVSPAVGIPYYTQSTVVFDGFDGGSRASRLENRNNFYAFNTGGFSTTSPGTAASTYDVVWQSVSTSNNVSGTWLIESDPIYRPALDSPWLDAGDPATAAGGRLDFLGQPRIQGSRVAIGAIESGVVTNYLRIIRVRPDGDDGGDGSSWALAVRSLDRAMSFARHGEFDVWVAGGDYSRGETLMLPEGVRLLGGFAGTEETESERDWIANPTILKTNGVLSANGWPFITAVSTRARTEISGFRFNPNAAYPAGGIWLTGHGKISHNHFSGLSGRPLSGNSQLLRGGSIRCTASSSALVDISNNHFEKSGNTDIVAGYLDFPYNMNRLFRLVNNTFDLSSRSNANAIFVGTDYRCEIANNLFVGGNIGAFQGPSPVVRSNANASISEVNAAGLVFLKEGSRFIDAGDSSFVAAGDVSLGRTPRIAGAGVDIGATEFSAGSETNRTVRVVSPPADSEYEPGVPLIFRFETGPEHFVVAGCQLVVNGVVVASAAVTDSSIQWTPPAEGTRYVQVRVFDRDGNYYESAVLTIGGPDRPPLIGPVDVAPLSRRFDRLPGEMTVTVSVSDTEGLTNVAFGLGDTVLLSEAPPANALEYTATFKYPVAQSGNQRVFIVATDRAGQSTRKDLEVSFLVGGWEFLAYRFGESGSLHAVNTGNLAIGYLYDLNLPVQGPVTIRDGVVTPVGSANLSLKAVNNHGVAVGNERITNSLYNAVVVSNGVSRRIVFENSTATGINDSGAVVGMRELEEPHRWRGYLWKDGVITDLPDPATGFGLVNVNGINNRGEICGVAQFSGGSQKPVIWKNGEIIELPLGEGFYGSADVINDNGTIGGYIGYFTGPSATVWRDSETIDYGPGSINAISPRGYVAGIIPDANDPLRYVPFIDRGRGVERLLQLLPVYFEEMPIRITGINDNLWMTAFNESSGQPFLIVPARPGMALPLFLRKTENGIWLNPPRVPSGPQSLLERSSDLKTWTPWRLISEGEPGGLIPEVEPQTFLRLRILNE